MGEARRRLLIEKDIAMEKVASECEGCLHCRHEESNGAYECRAHPPSVTPLIKGINPLSGRIELHGTITVYPMAMKRCGEYLQNPVAPAKPS